MDYNNLTITGRYIIGKSIVDISSNTPIRQSTFMEVYNLRVTNNYGVLQKAYILNTNDFKVYYRYNYGDTWTDWLLLYSV